MTESQVNSIVSKMASFLPTSWPKLVETLSKTASAKSWDVIRCLVLGPPEKEVAKTIVNPGWKFADRFEDGEKLKVQHYKINLLFSFCKFCFRIVYLHGNICTYVQEILIHLSQ